MNVIKVVGSLQLTSLLVLSVLCLVVLEIFTYTGAVNKHLGVELVYLVYLAAAVISLQLLQILIDVKTQFSSFYTSVVYRSLCRVSYFLLVSSMLTYFVFDFLEQSHFPNYVFSSFGINYTGIALLLLLLFLLAVNYFLDQHLVEVRDRLRFLKTYTKLQRAILVIFSVICISMSFSTIIGLYRNWIDTASLIGKPYNEKMLISLGGKERLGWIVPLSDLIHDTTPEDAVVFLPPQQAPWQVTGNGGYMRYFIHPRKFVVSNQIQQPIPAGVTHILISHGISAEADSLGWPQIVIPAEEIKNITYIDRNTGRVEVKTNVEYRPTSDIEEWGIITLKR